MPDLISRMQEVVMNSQAKTAITGDVSMTFSTLWSQMDAFAGGLQTNDITAGDHVVIRVSNPRAFLVAFYGTLRNGCVPVTVPTEFSADDVVAALEETGAKAYVTDETPFLAILHHADDVRLAITVDCGGGMGMDFPTFLDNDGINSAGSRTGIDVVSRPHSERGLVAYGRHLASGPLGIIYSRSALLAAARIGQTIPPSDGPIHHLGSLSLSNPIELLSGVTAALLSGGQYAAIFTGGRHYPQTSWDPDTTGSLLETGSATRTFLTPKQQDTVRTPAVEGDGAVVVAELAADPITPQATATGADAGAGSTCVLGCPETGLTHVSTISDDESAATTASRPIGETVPSVETRVLDGTELAVTGPAVMDGYVGRSALTDELIEQVDGTRWVRTGVTVTEGGAVDPIDGSPLAVLDRSHS